MSADFVPEFIVGDADCCEVFSAAVGLGDPHTPWCPAAPADAEQAKQALMDAFLYAHNRTTGVRNYTYAINDMLDAAKAYCAATGQLWRAVPVHASPVPALIAANERMGEIATTGISAVMSEMIPNHESTMTITPVAAE